MNTHQLNAKFNNEVGSKIVLACLVSGFGAFIAFMNAMSEYDPPVGEAEGYVSVILLIGGLAAGILSHFGFRWRMRRMKSKNEDRSLFRVFEFATSTALVPALLSLANGILTAYFLTSLILCLISVFTVLLQSAYLRKAGNRN